MRIEDLEDDVMNEYTHLPQMGQDCVLFSVHENELMDVLEKKFVKLSGIRLDEKEWGIVGVRAKKQRVEIVARNVNNQGLGV